MEVNVEEVVVVGLMPMKTPEAGSGKGLELGVDTTPAGGRAGRAGPTTRNRSGSLGGQLLELAEGIDHDAEEVLPRAGGQGDPGPVKVTVLIWGLADG